MKKYSLQLRGYRIILSLMLLMGILVLDIGNAFAVAPNRPLAPVLSLTSARKNYVREWYPDGRIWLPVSQPNEAREFLLPVFIENQWFHYKSTSKSDVYIPDKIFSFSFKILFDSLAIKPLGIVKNHPFPDTNEVRARKIALDGLDYYYEPYGKDFYITWHEFQDSTYEQALGVNTTFQPSLQVRGRGRAIKIDGISETPLPNTDTAQDVDGDGQFAVLFYFRFRLNQSKVSFNKIVGNTPIYIASYHKTAAGAVVADTIMFNDWVITKDPAFKEKRSYYPYVINDYPNLSPSFFPGVGGMDNRELTNFLNDGIIPGMIYLRMTEKLPMFGERLERSLGQKPAILEASSQYWVMQDPLTIDSGKVNTNSFTQNIYPPYGTRTFRILNAEATTRLTDIYVESDAPWLEFRMTSQLSSKVTPANFDVTKGYINWLDEILGCSTPVDCWTDNMIQNTAKDPDVNIELRCKPEKIQNYGSDDPTHYGSFGGEQAGVYVGHITFRSQSADVNTVIMRVTFINFRDPFEPPLYEENGLYTTTHAGIRLTVQNHNTAVPALQKLVFGTAHRGTNGADSLFGEIKADHELGNYLGGSNNFEARWYLPDSAERADKAPLGFGDFFPNDERPETGVILYPYTINADTVVGTGSRDIRNIHDTTESLVYLCKYTNPSPISIYWDLQDFPQDAILFLSDTANGSLFPSVNMREATNLGGSRYSYFIDDPNVTSFKITYTLPKIFKYLDPDGTYGIKKGWNFLSMPLRPLSHLKWNQYFRKAMNIPYYYSFVGGYQFKEEVDPGVGYFIKYSDSVDKSFIGVTIKRITKDVNDIFNPEEDVFSDKISIYPGWNAIGALSTPLNIKDMSFDQHDFYPSEPLPDMNFVLEFGVWGYNTNNGYYQVSVMNPARGYWIKSDRHAYLKLIAKYNTNERPGDKVDLTEQSNTLLQATRFTVRDNAQHEGTLYMLPNVNADVTSFELPPAPPAELFDARFDNNRFVDNSNSSVMNLQGIAYPVSINVDYADANYTFFDVITNQKLGEIKKGGNGVIEIQSTKANKVKVLRNDLGVSDFTLVNYPNPVVSTSTIKYTIPNNELVSIKLYDAMGNVVNEIFNGYRTAGEYTALLNAETVANLTNGRYICKLTAGSHTSVLTISIVK
ncbi:MAG: T9SS type A sorting domain-containing protein [Bacteroidota bacterium]